MEIFILTSDFLKTLTDGELVDYFYNEIDIDPDGKGDDVRMMEREIARRELTSEQMSQAWNALAAEQSAIKERDPPY